jgi:hypothetical protein
MSAAQNIFKPGERIAIPTLPILKIENDVAVLKKTRFAIGAECGARHRVRIETPFYVRGGFRVQRKTMYKVPGDAFEVVFKTPYGSLAKERVPRRSMYIDEEPNVREFAEKLVREEFGGKVAEVANIEVKEQVKPIDVYVRKFKYAEVWLAPDGNILEIRKSYKGDTYFVYEFVSPDEAKLVDDTSRIDYVLLALGHGLESRVGCAQIKILGGDIVWQEVKSTCCAIRSGAVAVVIARYGSKVAAAYNNLPYRGCCEGWEIEEWEGTFPPRRVTSYTATEPVATDLKPEEVV